MTDKEKRTLINYRLDRSNESLKAAEILFNNDMYIPAMNRIYYAMFYAVQALIILNDKAFSKHSQVKGFFNKAYIKTGILPKEFGRLFNIVFEYRQKFDYVDLITPDKELISDYISKADYFIEKITSFIQSELNSL